MRTGDQKGERTMAQECLIFLMALIVTFAICDCLQIISFKSRYKIEKSQSRHLDFCRNRVGPYLILLGENKCNFRLALSFSRKTALFNLARGNTSVYLFFLISRKTLQGHKGAYCLWSQRSLAEPLFRYFWSSLQMAGMDGETNSQMAVSLMSSLFANIVAAKFTVMQRYLE